VQSKSGELGAPDTPSSYVRATQYQVSFSQHEQ